MSVSCHMKIDDVHLWLLVWDVQKQCGLDAVPLVSTQTYWALVTKKKEVKRTTILIMISDRPKKIELPDVDGQGKVPLRFLYAPKKW